MIVLIVTWCSLLLLITTRSATLVICHASILLLGTKDVGKSIKNSIHLFGQSAEPLLCFSVIMVMGDNHEDGLEFGSETGWIIKSVPGVLPSLELERLVSVLGLAFQLPYVPIVNSTV